MEEIGTYIYADDVPHGAAGKAFVTREDGRNYELFAIKNFSAKASLNESDFKVVGTKKVQTKATGIKTTGSFTLYEGTSTFFDMIEEFQNTNRLPKFTMQITNIDPGTSIGTKTILYTDCQLSGDIDLQKLDAEQERLEMSVNFTALRFDSIAKYTDPDQLGG
jgi:hypothetical protein